MFGRKNQTILSSHYNKLVEQDETSGINAGDNDDEDEDFFSLKRADHDLPTDLAEHSDLSKRKIRMIKSKKALVKSGPRGTKLVFDEDGQPRAVYEFKDVNDVDVEGDGAEFLRKEIGKMQRADVDDKAAAKEKKKEKKRKRKEREREEVMFTTTRSTIFGVVELNGFMSSEATMGNTAVLRLLLLQTTTAMFPQCSISHQSQMTEHTSLPRRRRNPAKGTNLPPRWRKKNSLH